MHLIMMPIVDVMIYRVVCLARSKGARTFEEALHVEQKLVQFSALNPGKGC